MSQLEETLLLHIRASGLPEPEREVQFHARKWRFDLCWPEQRLAVEVDGGLRVYGRHQRPEGYERDAEKLNEAAIAGYRVLRFTRGMIERGLAVQQLARALDAAQGGSR